MNARASTPEEDSVRARLLARKRDLLAEQEIGRSELAGVLAARADGSADDEHDPEGSTLSSDWSRLTGLSGDRAAQLADVDDALARLLAGEYGACLECGRPIDSARLEARPTAALCIECARMREQ
ncbi:TraR/DksA C4-type zinc finger protein [soil metagenome]